MTRKYLLLQPHYTGPLLLQQPLVLFPRGIVETLGYVGFFPERFRRLWRVYNAQICDYGLVPGLSSVMALESLAVCNAHSSSACRSVNIALMAEWLGHTRLTLDWTMHYRDVVRSRVRSGRRFLVGAGNCGERRMVAGAAGGVSWARIRGSGLWRRREDSDCVKQ